MEGGVRQVFVFVFLPDWKVLDRCRIRVGISATGHRSQKAGYHKAADRNHISVWLQ